VGGKIPKPPKIRGGAHEKLYLFIKKGDNRIKPSKKQSGESPMKKLEAFFNLILMIHKLPFKGSLL
jgi:hypothetical protein